MSYSDDDITEARKFYRDKSKKENRYAHLLPKLESHDETLRASPYLPPFPYLPPLYHPSYPSCPMISKSKCQPRASAYAEDQTNYDSSIEFSSVANIEDSAKSSSSSFNNWPDISMDDTCKAIDFFLSIESQYLDELYQTHQHVRKERRNELIIHALFPKFISFFNSNFAPINNLPLNGVRPDTFFRACSELLSTTHTHDEEE